MTLFSPLRSSARPFLQWPSFTAYLWVFICSVLCLKSEERELLGCYQLNDMCIPFFILRKSWISFFSMLLDIISLHYDVPSDQF